MGLGPLKFECNQELSSRYLLNKGIVIDIGGPGIYAEWLAKLGHQVTLIDPVQKHIKQAEKWASRLKKQVTNSYMLWKVWVWLDRNYFETRADASKKQGMMELLHLTETDQALMALSPHVMIAADKV